MKRCQYVARYDVMVCDEETNTLYRQSFGMFNMAKTVYFSSYSHGEETRRRKKINKITHVHVVCKLFELLCFVFLGAAPVPYV